jgi:hypothetical protein
MQFGLRLVGMIARGLGVVAALLLMLPLAAAADLPMNGSKNFTPPSGTPSYFTDENGQVHGGAAGPTDTEEREEAAPAPAQPPADTAAIAPRQETAPTAAESDRAADKSVSRAHSRHGRHGGRYARSTHSGAPLRLSAGLHRDRGGRATARAASHSRARLADHRGGSHPAASKSKTAHSRPKSSRQHTAIGPAAALDSA